MAEDCGLVALGVVSALGHGVDETWPRLLAGETAGLRQRDDFVPGVPVWVGEAPGPLPEVPAQQSRYACRNNALCLAALEQIAPALDDARTGTPAERIGVVMGTSTSGVGDAEQAIRHQVRTGGLAPSFDYAQLEFGGIAAFVAEWSGARGPALTLSTACSSGARALATARSLLRLGVCDAVIAGATDTLCGLTTGGFSALHALSPDPTNPMSRNRAGLTLGEASAVFLVTRASTAIQLLGVGETSEAHHMSAPDPEGRGAENAMRRAVADAACGPEDVSYLNLHGTGTPLNDAMESHAVARVLGEKTPCSSTKPLVGHALGAAGALEAAFAWMLLDRSEAGGLDLPPHCWDGERDPELAPIRLVSKGERVRAERPVVMTNSFGFGGNNCTLVLGPPW